MRAFQIGLLQIIIDILTLGVCFAAPSAAGHDAVAEELMQRVRLSMPEVPLEMSARLRMLDRRGKQIKVVSAEVLLTPHGGGRSTRYTLLDAFGRTLEEMTVTQGEDGIASFSYRSGDPLESAPLPDLFSPIQGTDVSWMELSFSYFWWPDPRIVGSEKVANRWDCQMVDLVCPPTYEDGWDLIRLWVAPAYSAVIRGEAWKDGRPLKRFEVKSIRKLRKVYMIGDMDVRNLETGARAQLQVLKMKMLSPEYSDEELEAFNAPVTW